MSTTAVAMFCGPHDEGDRTPTRRIDHAIRIALAMDLPLIVAGDAFNREEVQAFQIRAQEAGVRVVLTAFDARRCTLSDAQATATRLRELGHHVERLHLVTDWWHMGRSWVMMRGEARTSVLIVPAPVFNGPLPCLRTLYNELRGAWHYLSGTYGQHVVVDPLRHAP
ncbi:MAG: YdcF family protein [Candidatus Uhrbacteria bacterium]|nr:YdcF family protein [Candidatus Uhrbacteria bacterium]